MARQKRKRLLVRIIGEDLLRPGTTLREVSLWNIVMNAKHFHHIYGPVPSRRLGRSLGIDLVPFKTCTYDCIYCHLGRTTNKTIKRKEYVVVSEVLSELEQKLACEDAPEYISLAGSGEPTLNSGIGELILKIKSMTNIPVAVLTNSSLLWMKDVQNALMPADFVIPSLDAGDGMLYQHVNRPHKDISFEQMVDGLIGFTSRYKGSVYLEVFLLAGVTGIRDEVEKIAFIIKRLKLKRVQMNTVIRPPAEEFAKPLSRNQMLALKNLLPGEVDIIGDIETRDWRKLPGDNSLKNDILSLLRRRPCTCMDVARGLGMHASEALKHLDALIASEKAMTVRMSDKTFYAPKGSKSTLRP
jgi:wyosine [tRNA(Phe)-imidazoG37] synthetase (radical SAM superfamily)